MNRTIRFFLIAILICCLIAARFLFQKFLYDPLFLYFRNSYLVAQLPEIDQGLYFFNLFIRFVINSFLSLGIIYLVFMKYKIVVFSIKFYMAAFVGFGLFLFLLLNSQLIENQLLIFYVRRFLIQPVFLLILLPAFYIQKWNKIAE